MARLDGAEHCHGHALVRPRREAGTRLLPRGEGHAGFKRRLAAWELHHHTEILDAPLYFSKVATSLMDAANMQEVAWAIDRIADEKGAPRLIIVDTLHRNFGPGDENSAKDLAIVLNHLDQVRERYRCCVLLVHHVGHGDPNRARGSSAFRAAMDFDYLAREINGNISIGCKKSKDAEPPADIVFAKVSITLPWQDEDGVAQSSLALELTAGVNNVGSKPLSLQAQIALDALHAVTSTAAADFGPEPGQADVDSWRAEALARGLTDSADQESRRKAFQRSRAMLMQRGLVACTNERYRLTH